MSEWVAALRKGLLEEFGEDRDRWGVDAEDLVELVVVPEDPAAVLARMSHVPP